MPIRRLAGFLAVCSLLCLISVTVASGRSTDGAAKPKRGGTYSGKSSQGLPVLVKVSADGTKLSRYRITFRPKCTQIVTGDVRFTLNIVPEFLPAIRIRNGSFDSGDDAIPLKGRFTSARTVTGTIRVPKGEAEPCGTFSTGVIRWSARLRNP